MISSGAELVIPCAVALKVTADSLVVDLDDGRSIACPLSWYPRLLHATPAERAAWRFIGRGDGIRWDLLDEDISVESLIAGRASQENPESLSKWLSARGKGR